MIAARMNSSRTWISLFLVAIAAVILIVWFVVRESFVEPAAVSASPTSAPSSAGSDSGARVEQPTTTDESSATKEAGIESNSTQAESPKLVVKAPPPAPIPFSDDETDRDWSGLFDTRCRRSEASLSGPWTYTNGLALRVPRWSVRCGKHEWTAGSETRFSSIQSIRIQLKDAADPQVPIDPNLIDRVIIGGVGVADTYRLTPSDLFQRCWLAPSASSKSKPDADYVDLHLMSYPSADGKPLQPRVLAPRADRFKQLSKVLVGRGVESGVQTHDELAPSWILAVLAPLGSLDLAGEPDWDPGIRAPAILPGSGQCDVQSADAASCHLTIMPATRGSRQFDHEERLFVKFDYVGRVADEAIASWLNACRPVADPNVQLDRLACGTNLVILNGNASVYFDAARGGLTMLELGGEISVQISAVLRSANSSIPDAEVDLVACGIFGARLEQADCSSFFSAGFGAVECDGPWSPPAH